MKLTLNQRTDCKKKAIHSMMLKYGYEISKDDKMFLEIVEENERLKDVFQKGESKAVDELKARINELEREQKIASELTKLDHDRIKEIEEGINDHIKDLERCSTTVVSFGNWIEYCKSLLKDTKQKEDD